jgi:hypothetical protein
MTLTANPQRAIQVNILGTAITGPETERTSAILFKNPHSKTHLVVTPLSVPNRLSR